MGNERISLANFDDIPGSLPHGSFPESFDTNALAKEAVEQLNTLHERHLAPNAIWRDILSFTDTFRTFHSPAAVCETFLKLSAAKKRSPFRLVDSEPRTVRVPGNANWIDFDVHFIIQDDGLTGNCAGIVSLAPTASGDWNIWMLRTWLDCYDGHGHPDTLTPERQDDKVNDTVRGGGEHIHDVIVVGGGQAGLAAAGRLKALGVESIVFDERPKIGDSWSHRYDSVKWHTTREFGNLPFGRTFMEEDPVLLPANRIGSAYKEWSEKYKINVQESTRVDKARWEKSTQSWIVYTSSTCGERKWQARDVVMATGVGGNRPNLPSWATADKITSSNFKGTILHSADYQNVNVFANKPGSRGIVIGSANTAHDIAEDMANIGMHTTMCQRSPTLIIPGELLVALNDAEYDRTQPTDVSDNRYYTQPAKIMREQANRGIWMVIKHNAERFDALEKAGFKLDRYGDLIEHLTTRKGGHYIDVGNCARIVKGEVKMKGEAVERLAERGLRFEDGSELEADVIVLCTGFERSFRKAAAAIVGEEIAGQMDDFGGPDKEGEMRGMAKLAGHPHLFYTGGDVRSARFLSRFLALQLQKRKLGAKLEPYLEGK